MEANKHYSVLPAMIQIKDRPGYRTCGVCGKTLPIDRFYKDGTTTEGAVKYRRDCKECHNSKHHPRKTEPKQSRFKKLRGKR